MAKTIWKNPNINNSNNISLGQSVAVKVQNNEHEATVIRWESEVLKNLIEEVTVPRFIHFGQHDKYNYLVMELLIGEDMATLRNRIRNTSGSSGLISLPVYFELVISSLIFIFYYRLLHTYRNV